MSEILIDKNASFTIDVPYKLVSTGKQKKKPLIVYLHGYKQNLEYFEKKMAEISEFEAYHLFLQGPYPIYDEKHRRSVDQWGRAWYLYDGNQEQFLSSMEKASVFIQQIIDDVRKQINARRLALLGYSMGGYLAGYFALSRPKYINDLIVIGGRIKTEHFSDQTYDNLNVLALHGNLDNSVAADRQKQSCNDLQKLGAAVTFRTVDEQHRLSVRYTREVKRWLKSHNYMTAS